MTKLKKKSIKNTSVMHIKQTNHLDKNETKLFQKMISNNVKQNNNLLLIRIICFI